MAVAWEASGGGTGDHQSLAWCLGSHCVVCKIPAKWLPSSPEWCGAILGFNLGLFRFSCSAPAPVKSIKVLRLGMGMVRHRDRLMVQDHNSPPKLNEETRESDRK